MNGQERGVRAKVPSASGGWSVSLRTYVIGAMLVALLPLLAHAVLTTWTSSSSSRAWAERDLVSDAEHLARDIDTRLDVPRMLMRIVAASPAAQRGDLAAMREHLTTARAQGAISAGIVRDTEDGVLLAEGLTLAEAGEQAAGQTEQFLVRRLGGRVVLLASWPIRSRDARLARLEFVVGTEVLPSLEGGSVGSPWHVSAFADRNGHVAWPADAASAPMPPAVYDQTAMSGVTHDWVSPQGDLHANAFARAPRSGLTVVIGQPMPSLYDRVPFGPAGSVAVAAALALVSIALARIGAGQIHAAYRAAVNGVPGGRVHIDEALRLGAEIRRSRDRLLQATGGIAVVELTRPQGGLWRDGTIAASPNLCELLGQPADEPLSFDSLVRNLAAEDREALRQAALTANGRAHVFGRLVRVPRKDVSTRHVNVVGMLRESLPGLDDDLVLTLQDVTAQRETEMELQATASRLKLATDLAGVGVWERDVVHGIGDATERLREIIGLDVPGPMAMANFLDLVHPDDRDRVAGAIATISPEEVAAAGQPAAPPQMLRYRIVRPDGSVRHVRSNRVFLHDAAGRVHRAVGVLIDETEAVLAQRTLAASEARFRLAVEVAELGVFERIIDPHSNVGVWNERMWRMRGLEPRPEPMTAAEMLDMVHPDDRARIEAAMRSRREGADGTTDYEFRIVRPDGEERIIQSRSTRTYHPEDQSLQIVAINLDVTERRRAERTIAESEARFRLGAEIAELGVAEIDVATGDGTWNERLWRMCGLEPRAGRPGHDEAYAMIHPDDRKHVDDAHAAQAQAADGTASEYEFRIIRTDGAERIVHVRSVTLRDRNGGVKIFSVNQDVTERRQAERTIAESEARFRLAVETAELGVAELEPATGRGMWSERMFRICGLEPRAQRPSGEEMLSLIHPEDRPGMSAMMAAQLESEDRHVAEYECRVLHADGQERIAHLRNVLLTRADGTRVMFSIAQDVTERRQAELALAESEARFRLAVETAGLGVAELDPQTGRGVWNDQLYRMVGLPPRGERPSQAELLTMIHPDDRAGMQEAIARQREAREGNVAEFECRMVRPDGEERVLHLRNVVLRRADGRFVQASIAQDVTEQRRAQRAIAESEARFRLAVDIAELGVAEINVVTGEGVWNERMYRIGGITPRPGRPSDEEVMSLVHPGDRDLVTHNFQTQRDSGAGHVTEFEFRVGRPDGKERILHARSVMMRHAGAHGLLLTVFRDVTEGRQAERSIAASEARFRLAVDTAELGVAELNTGTGQGVWNDRQFRICGLEPRAERPDFAETLALVHPDDRERFAAIMVAQRDGMDGHVTEADIRMVRPDGKERVIHLHSVTMRNVDGSATLLTVNQDITERRAAERALADSEARFRLAVDTAELGVAELDPDTGRGVWNERLFRICGVEPRGARLPLAEVLALVHPDDHDRVAAELAQQKAGGNEEVQEYEFRMVRPDREERVLVVRSVLLRRVDGSRTLLTVTQDVTDQRQAVQRVADSEMRLRLATEATGVGIWDYEPASGTAVWSDRMWRLRGMEPRPEPLSIEEQLAHAVPEDHPVLRRVWAWLEAGEPQFSYDYRVVLPDGGVRHLHGEGRSLRDASGSVTRSVGMVVDVTPQRVSELALRDKTVTLELALEAADLGVWVRDIGKSERDASARVWSMLGRPGREGPMSMAELMEGIHPEDRDAVLRDWVRPQEDAMPRRRAFRSLWPDGSVHYINSYRVVLRDTAGHTLRVIGVIADVTEARRATAALEASEARLRLAVEAAEMGVFDYDPDTREGHWSDREWRLRGLEPRPGIPSREEVRATVHPDDRAEAMAKADVSSIAPDGTRIENEFRVVWPNGTVRHLQMRALVQRGADGRARVFGVNMDVTERRVAALALADSEARLRLAVETAALGVFDDEPATRNGYWSERMWRMRGLEPQPMKPTFDEAMALVHPEDRPRLLTRIAQQETLPAGTLGETEFRVVWPDGSIHHIQSRAITQRDSHGGVVRVFGINLDVTESRRAAEELAATAAQLRLAVDTAAMGVFDYEPGRRDGHWSERMWRMRGLEPRAQVPRYDESLSLVHPDDRERVRARNQAQEQEQEQERDGTVSEIEFRILWPDGSTHYLQSRAIAQRDADGRVVRIFGINLDVTESRRAARALETSEAQLRLAMDTAGMGMFEFDVPTRRGVWSERMWRMRGLEPRPGDLPLDEALAMIHPEDRERVVSYSRSGKVPSDGEPADFLYRVILPDGAVRFIQARAITLRGTDGTADRIFGINLDVTESRRAAQALEESEARFRLASEIADLGVFQVRMPEGEGYWSERMWRVRGWEPQPGLPGIERALSVVHPDDREMVRTFRMPDEPGAHGEISRLQYRIFAPDGSVRHILARSIVLHGRTEGSWTYTGVNADVTEQVEREQALRETAARFELAIDAAGLGVWDWDPKTRVVTWSPRMFELAGLPVSDQTPSLEVREAMVHPEDRDLVLRDWFERLLSGKEERSEVEFRGVRADGSIRYVHWQGRPLRDAQGGLMRFMGVAADVTDARLAEATLRSSEELFRMASEAAEQGVWNHDLETDVLTWSPRMWRIHGLPPTEGAPTREERIALIHPEDRDDVLGLPEELLGGPPNLVARRSYRIVRPDGAVRTLERQAMLVRGPDGTASRIVGVIHDVTEARELSAQAMVADKLATLGEMAGAIAHELAQPLQAVMATAATARVRLVRAADDATVEGVRERLAWIERQTARAGKTIQHLLSFSRGESSESFTRLPLAVEGALELAGHGLRRARIEVTIDLAEDLPAVRGGQIEIEQVLVNLLNNARDAIGEREVRRVAILARSVGGTVVLDVSDTGGGVPADRLERIFEPFYTTKAVGRGTGIGLSIARRTMRALGGAIAVSNTELGACFSLTFPSMLVGD